MAYADRALIAKTILQNCGSSVKSPAGIEGKCKAKLRTRRTKCGRL